MQEEMESAYEEEENTDLKALFSPKNPAPICRSKLDLKKFIASLIGYSAKLKEDTSEKIVSQVLKNEKFIDDIAKTARGIQTHNTKIPDANNALPGAFYRSVQHIDENYIYSGTTSLKRTLFWSGNAAELGKKNFLIAQFVYSDKLTSLAEEIYFSSDLNSDSILILKELGISDESLQKLKNSLADAFLNVPLYAIDPQLFWPVGDDYVCITPVISCAMQREIFDRRTAFNDGFYREFETIGVAGSNPGNAGDLSSAITGKFKLITAKIPRSEHSSKQKMWRSLFYKKTTFKPWVFRKIVFSDYLEDMSEGAHHFKRINKDLLKQHLELYIEDAFQETLELYDNIHLRGYKIPDWVEKRISDPELEFLYDLNAKRISAFSIYCTSIIKNRLNPEKDFIDLALEEFISDVFSFYLGGALL